MSVSISAAFSKEDRELNGLEAIAKELIDQPLKRHVVVGIVETIRITKDVKDGGTETPTVRFLQIEPLEGDVAERARMMLSEASEARTGRGADETLFDADQADDDEPDLED